MGWNDLPTAILIAMLGLLLLSAGIEDARIREIANWKNTAVALLAPLWWWVSGLAPWPDMAMQVLVAAIVLGLFCIAFARGWMGGGDVKLIAALALWFPLGPLLTMLMTMSIAGGLLTIAMMIDRAIRKVRSEIEIPYGVAIAAAAMLILPQIVRQT